MTVVRGVGMSCMERGGTWRVRWRQDEQQPDGSTIRKHREVVAGSRQEADRVSVDVEKQLRERGFWLPA